MKRKTLILVLSLVVLVVAVYSFVRSGHSRVLAEINGRIIAEPTGSGGTVAWLEGDEEEVRMIACTGNGAPREIIASPGLSALALSGESAYVTRRTGSGDTAPRTELLRVPLSADSAEHIANVPYPADDMVSGDGWLCWLERRKPALPKAPFIVAGEPVAVIRATPEPGGEISTLAVIQGAFPGSREGVEVLGVVDGRAYWVERHASADGGHTTVCRAPVSGGRIEELVEEDGDQAAVVADGALVWTAHSLEAAQPEICAAVRKSALDGTAAEEIGDWIGSGCQLLSANGEVFVQEKSRLWLLGAGPRAQRLQCRESSSVITATASGDREYLVTWRGGNQVVAVRNLTLWSRVRSMVRL